MRKKISHIKIPNPKSTARGLLPVYILIAVFIVSRTYQSCLSGDVWWQLKTGQWITVHHALPFIDPFAKTVTHPIVLQEWAAEVVCWLIYHHISPSALAVMSVLLMSAAFFIAFRMALVRSRNVPASFIVVMVGVSAAAYFTEVRPHVYTAFFFALAVVILTRFHQRGGRIIWLLPPLILVWANFHGGVIAGLALIALETFIALVSPPDWAREHKYPRLAAAVPLLGVFVAAALLALVNPNGTWVYRYSIMILGHSSVKSINEWASPSFHEAMGQFLIVFFGLIAVGLAMLPRRPSFRDFCYVVCFAAASLVARRNIVFLVIACSAPIALWLSCAMNQAESWLTVRRMAGHVRVAAWILITILVATSVGIRIADARGKMPFDYMVNSGKFASAACDFLESHKISGPMFNDINYGGYLMFRLWPKHQVFVDTRIEPFIGGAWEDAVNAIYCTSPGSWQQVFDNYDINFAVLSPCAPLSSVLRERSDWVCVYHDEKAVIFIRDTQENASVIEASRTR